MLRHISGVGTFKPGSRGGTLLLSFTCSKQCGWTKSGDAGDASMRDSVREVALSLATETRGTVTVRAMYADMTTPVVEEIEPP